MALQTLNLILILLISSVIVVAVFVYFRLPTILAYLLVGIVIGPHGIAWVPHSEDAHFLAEFGVVFLLFTIGLEFSIARLTSMKKEVLGVGGSQVVLTTAFFVVILGLVGFSIDAAVILGGVLAMSSTAIVIKQLKDQGELGMKHGRLSVAILLFQDIAVVPFLILVTAISASQQGSLALDLSWAMFKGFAVITLMLFLGWWLLRPLFSSIVSVHSSELFTLTALLFAIAAAWLSHYAGLSFALGAFLAGMILGETEFRHQIEADIRPFRDVLLGLFFVTMGMMLDVHVVPDMAIWIVLLVIAILLMKIVLIMTLSMIFGISASNGLRSGLILAQGGEFGMALLMIAFTNGLLDNNIVQIVLAAIIISMMMSPILIKYNEIIHDIWVKNVNNKAAYNSDDNVELDRYLSGHVIIAGYGKVGCNLAKMLQQNGFEYIGVDLNTVKVREARNKGEKVHYGDASQQSIINAVGLNNARVIVIAIDDVAVAEKIIEQVKVLNKDMPILVWIGDESHKECILEKGVTEVVTRNSEASLMLESSLLQILDVPVEEIMMKIRQACSTRYPEFSDLFK